MICFERCRFSAGKQFGDAFGELFAIRERYVVSKRRIDFNPTNVISADRQLTDSWQTADRQRTADSQGPRPVQLDDLPTLLFALVVGYI